MPKPERHNRCRKDRSDPFGVWACSGCAAGDAGAKWGASAPSQRTACRRLQREVSQRRLL